MLSFTIRPALKTDVKALAEVRASLPGMTLESLIPKFTNELESYNKAKGIIFIAKHKEKIIGYGRCQLYSGKDDDSLYETAKPLPSGWYLRGVVVLPEFHRIGIAKALTLQRLSWLDERTDTVHCFLDSDEKVSLPMYLQCGFQEISCDWEFKDSKKDDSGILLLRKSI